MVTGGRVLLPVDCVNAHVHSVLLRLRNICVCELVFTQTSEISKCFLCISEKDFANSGTKINLNIRRQPFIIAVATGCDDKHAAFHAWPI